MKKIIISVSLFFMLISLSYGQEREHIFSVQAGGGLHHLKYTPSNGEEKAGAGFSFDANYGYFLGKHVGIITGLGIQSLKSTATISSQTSISDTDADGDSYQFRTSYNNWKENQSSLMLSTPIGVAFRGDWTKKVSWYASAGARVFMPIQSKYKVEGGSIVTSGFYPQWNVELTDMPQHGFTTVEGNIDGDATLKTSFGAFMNAGAAFKLNERLNLIAGVYGNYGFTSATDKADVAPYQKNGTYNSIINSNLASKTNVFSAGVQVGLVWHFGKKKKSKKVAEAPVSQPVVHPVEQSPAKGITETKVEKVEKQSTQLVNDSISDPFIKARKIAKSATIRFGLKSDMPYMADEDKVKELSLILKANPNMRVVVTGHTCDIANEQINTKISRERAETIKLMFMQQGVSEKQIRCEAMAQKKPLVPNTSEANKTKNRRVELDIEKINI